LDVQLEAVNAIAQLIAAIGVIVSLFDLLGPHVGPATHQSANPW
jgi:hypothetical protein